MSKELVIFDADGTLANTNHQFVAAYQQAFQQMKCVVDPVRLLALIGMGHDHAIPMLTSPEWHKKHGEELADLAERIYLKDYLKKSKFFPGVLEILEDLKKRGKMLALASSSQRVIVEHYLTMFPEGSKTFQAIVTFDDVTHSKPDPELFLCALALSKMPAEKACTVGDSAWDMKASGAAKIDAIGVLSGGTAREELQQFGAKEIYRDVKDLHEHIDTSLIFLDGHRSTPRGQHL